MNSTIFEILRTISTLVIKSPPANAAGIRDGRLNPWVRKIPGEGNGSTFQYSCLENSTDREAWQAIVYRVAKSWTH